MLNQLNVSHGKMSDFVSFSLFGFTLVIKLRNRNFSLLWLKWTQIMEMKKNQIFFHETHSDLASFFIRCKILKCLNDFYNWHVSISLHKWAQIIKRNEIKPDMCKFDNTFPYLQRHTLLNDFLNLPLDTVYLKNEC